MSNHYNVKEVELARRGLTLYIKVGGSMKHPGFKSVQSSIAAKEGVSKKRAGAMLAASTRRASASAKAANPRLRKVKG